MEIIKKLKEHITLVISLIVVISGLFVAIFNVLNQNDEILDKLQTTQQMALKSVIWNEEIPLPERASACDAYLAAGYNSLTKKECEKIIEKGVNDGIFSYAEREVNKDE